MNFGIEFQSVTKQYDPLGKQRPAVENISFHIEKGTLTTLLGPSGCGKTTTLRMIAGLESPSSGRVLIDGVDVTDQGPALRNVSLVFQNYALFPHLSVLENVAYGPSVAGMSKQTSRDKATRALGTVGLQGYEARMPGELSGGQQQRVALARALVLEPSVLLFDEPLSNLDSRLRRQMRDEIRALQQKLRLTVAYVTHDQSEALAVSDNIIVMNQGRIAQRGSPRDLYEHPRSAFVAGFMGEAVLMKAVWREGRFWLGSLALPRAFLPSGGADSMKASQEVTLAIRPECWQLQQLKGLPISALVPEVSGLPGVVKRVTYLGSSHELWVNTALGDIFMLAPMLSIPIREGDEVRLGLSMQGLALIESPFGDMP